MQSTYHLNSATELTVDIIEAIKIAFKSKPITITIEEELDTTTYLLNNINNKENLLKSIEEDKNGKHITVNIVK